MIDEMWRANQGMTTEEVHKLYGYDPNEIRMCGCIGPVRGDPYCFCTMMRKGLLPTPTPPEEQARMKAAFAEMFNWLETAHAEDA